MSDDATANVGGPASRHPGPNDLNATNTDESGTTSSNARVVIEQDILAGMTITACDKYKDCIIKFAAALAREVSHLEEAERAEDIDMPEITSTMVVKANDLIRHPPDDNTPTSIPTLIAQAVAFVGAILTPLFGTSLHSAWQWTVTVFCGIIALIAQVFAIVSVRRR